MIIPENFAIHKPKPELLNIINSKKFNDKILYVKESDFHNIKVVENEIGRFLHYGETYQAGFINTEYYKGNLPYINYFFLPYFYKKNIKKILLIGLGTGKIVKDYFSLCPDINLFDVVDIEENIEDIATKFFNYVKDEKTNFYLQDAIIFLKTTSKKYDLIIVDVANNDGIDERFIENSYLDLIKSHLKKDGIFVSNLCSSADFENKKNKFYKSLKTLYCNNFNSVKIYKGNYSDEVYYKSFFNINERVIDITNLIFLASKSNMNYLPDKTVLKEKFIKFFPNIDIEKIISDEVI